MTRKFETERAMTADSARQLFLDGVFIMRPEVLDDLFAKPYAVWCEFMRPLTPDLTRDDFPASCPLAQPELAPLSNAIRAWGKRCNLSDGWCLMAALNTLIAAGIREKPAVSAKRLQLADPDGELTYRKVSSYFTPFRFDASSPEYRWNPAVEKWSAMEQRAKGALASALDTYRREVKERIERFCVFHEPVDIKVEHICWLVGYQTSGWSINAISRAVYKNDSRGHVRGIVKSLAQFIGLTLHAKGKNSSACIRDRDAIDSTSEIQKAIDQCHAYLRDRLN